MKISDRYYLMLFIAVLAISGCSTSQVNVRPQELISPTVHTAVNVPSKDVTITVADFALKTGRPANIIGEAKTGFFNTLAPITVDEPANVMVSNAIKRGIANMGYRVLETGDADYRIEGAVEKLWVDEYATGWSFEYAKAHVRYDVILRDRSGKSVWAGTMEQFKTSGKSADATADDIPTLKIALNDSVSQLLENASFWHAMLK